MSPGSGLLPGTCSWPRQSLTTKEERVGSLCFAPVIIYSKGQNTLSPRKQPTKAASRAVRNSCLFSQRWLGLSSGVGYPATQLPWCGSQAGDSSCLSFDGHSWMNNMYLLAFLFSKITLPTEKSVFSMSEPLTHTGDSTVSLLPSYSSQFIPQWMTL